MYKRIKSAADKTYLRRHFQASTRVPERSPCTQMSDTNQVLQCNVPNVSNVMTDDHKIMYDEDGAFSGSPPARNTTLSHTEVKTQRRIDRFAFALQTCDF